MMQLQESFPFGDSGELFDIALKYASWRTPIAKVLKFSRLIFSWYARHKKFTKILSHENLEPYGILSCTGIKLLLRIINVHMQGIKYIASYFLLL